MKKLPLALASLSLILATASLGACSSDDSGDDDASSSSSSSGGASSGGGGSSSGGTGSSSSGGSSGTISSSSSSSSSSGSSGTAVLNDCTTFEDHSDSTDDVKIQWIQPVGANRCAKIKVGTKVIWDGDMVDHPLKPQGGDSGSPIVLTATNPSAEFVFPTAGDFGYVCTKHPIMQGVVQVVP